MSEKIQKLKEVHESVAKRCAELETYMFIENIGDAPVKEKQETAAEIK